MKTIIASLALVPGMAFAQATAYKNQLPDLPTPRPRSAPTVVPTPAPATAVQSSVPTPSLEPTPQPIMVRREVSKIDGEDFHDTYIEVSSDGTICFGTSTDYRDEDGKKQHRMNYITLRDSEQPLIVSALQKASEWSTTARKNNVEPFTKTISTYDGKNFLGEKETYKFEFKWDVGSGWFSADEEPILFTEQEVNELITITPQIPEMRAELKSKIEKSKTDAGLFK